MADYNYHRPDIVGQEWVPILDAHYEPDITVERGYTFKIDQTAGPLVLSRGIYHVEAVPPGVTTSQVPFVNVYPATREYVSGPVMKTIIPCSAATDAGPNGAFFGPLTGFQALLNPSDGSGFNFSTGPTSTTANGSLNLSFDVSASAINPFTNARIFNVSIIYASDGNGQRVATFPNFMQTSILYQGTNVFYGTGVLEGGLSQRGDTTTSLGRISLGEINPNWSTATYQANNDRYPWTTARLAAFDESAGTPMVFRFNWSFDNNIADGPSIQYVAMEVTWAPFDNRLAYGGRHLGFDQTSPLGNGDFYQVSDNFVMLRTANTLATGTGLRVPTGEYTITTHLADLGDMNQPIFGSGNAPAATNTRPTFNAIRELYQEPPIKGVEIDRILSPTDRFSIETSAIIPAIGVTVTGGSNVYSGCHGYVKQTQAFAFTLSSSTQSFQSVNLDGTLPYPQVRFYARLASGAPKGRIRFADAVGANNTYVEISGEALMSLPEIVDGWREVTLRFVPPSNVPTMDGSTLTRNWVWTVAGLSTADVETSYEILAAASSTILQNANYETSSFDVTVPFGKATTADATFLFSTDPPAVTGIGVSTESLAVTGIALDCATPPGCIPTGIGYNRITWALPNAATVVQDTFDRTVAGGWGTANTGQTWSDTNGVSGDYSVDATTSTGRHSHSATNTPHISIIAPTTTRDGEVLVEFEQPAIPGVPLTAGMDMGVVFRFVNTANYYFANITWTTTGLSELKIFRVLASTVTQLGSTVLAYGELGIPNVAHDIFRVRLLVQGSTFKLRVWDDSDPEPSEWMLTASDSSAALAAGQFGIRTSVLTGNTNTLPIVFPIHTFLVTAPADNFGSYELQRSDEYTDWQTILNTTSSGVTGFNDFESRIGVQSDYRIRQINVHGFEGPWSATVSATTPAPPTPPGGGFHELLVFTSNEDQTGSRALAYEEVWESRPTSDFTFLEGDGMMQFQRMYDRDYQVGFHGLERGGVQFERTLLVQNAAVSTPVLEQAFRSLRDLAWEELDYVCVRSNEGSRWFAAVEVPSGTIMRARRTQLVQVRITQVSDTSSVQDTTLPFVFGFSESAL